MKPSSVVLNVNDNLKMTLLQVYATLQGSHDLHSCLTSSNAASWQARALQIWVESSPPHHTASPSASAFIPHAVQGPASLRSLHVKPPCLWKAFRMRGGEAGGVAGNGWGWAVQRWALGAAGLSRRGAWPSSGWRSSCAGCVWIQMARAHKQPWQLQELTEGHTSPSLWYSWE